MQPAARGVALFLGLFTLLNGIAAGRSGSEAPGGWWLDLRGVSPVAAALAMGLLALTLIATGLALPLPGPWRIAQRGVLALALLTAVANAATFYGRSAPTCPCRSRCCSRASFCGSSGRIDGKVRSRIPCGSESPAPGPR